MENTEFQREVQRTVPPNLSFFEALSIGGLGVAGEAGEVADSIKKIVYHRHPLDTTKVAEELGDALWYIAFLCNTLGLSLGDVMQANVTKLRARYPDGWSSERSLNRAEYQQNDARDQKE
jgi:NTP pyrophosphatase (non-canonical NTP hydrolase)